MIPFQYLKSLMHLKFLLLVGFILAISTNAFALGKSGVIKKIIDDKHFEVEVKSTKRLKPNNRGLIWYYRENKKDKKIVGKLKILNLSDKKVNVELLSSSEPIKNDYYVSWYRYVDRYYKDGIKQVKIGYFNNAIYLFEAVKEMDPKTTTNMNKKISEAQQGLKDIASLKKITLARDTGFVINGVSFDMVKVLKGSYNMGSLTKRNGEQKHNISLTRDFFIGKYEITQEQWVAIMGSLPAQYAITQKNKTYGEIYGLGKLHPIYFVSWHAANEFCKKLSELTGDLYRLPTEAEWEYACRAGSNTLYYWGNNDMSSAAFAWHYGNANKSSQEAGQKIPNAWGIYDMVGNVGEFCSDWYELSYYSQSPEKDPQGPEHGDTKIIRGGAWVSRIPTRSGFRNSIKPDAILYDVGFRIVKEIK